MGETVLGNVLTDWPNLFKLLPWNVLIGWLTGFILIGDMISPGNVFIARSTVFALLGDIILSGKVLATFELLADNEIRGIVLTG